MKAFLKALLRLYQGTIFTNIIPFCHSVCVNAVQCLSHCLANLSLYTNKLCVYVEHVAEEAVPSICDVAAPEHYSTSLKAEPQLEAEPQPVTTSQNSRSEYC